MKKYLKLAFLTFAMIYIAVLLRATVIQDGVRTAANELKLVPFNTVFEYFCGEKSLKSLAINYLGNIFLFLPAGLILPVIFSSLNFRKTLVLGFIASVAIEIIQHFTGSGYADVDDVLMNVLGVMIGSIIYYYILGGKNKAFSSDVLALLVIMIAAISGFSFISRTNPQMLPDQLVIFSKKIAGHPIDSYDLEVKCYKMSHGEIFLDTDNAIGVKSSYFISDSPILVVRREENGKEHYFVVGIDEMISEVSKNNGCDLKVWLNKKGQCDIILAEEK